MESIPKKNKKQEKSKKESESSTEENEESECIGCKNGYFNQLGHMGPYGCLEDKELEFS